MRATFCRLRVFWASAIALSGVGSASAGPTVIVPASEDESVGSTFAEKNYSDNLNRGGLFVGCDGVGASRFYLKFELPQTIDPARLVAASLFAPRVDDLDPTDNGTHRIHFVAADDWHESTITWNNQPGPTFGSPDATFDAAAAPVGRVVRWDVTDLARRELSSDGILSLMFAASNESVERTNRNWEYFAEREFDPRRAFHLSLSTNLPVGSGGTAAIPLPAAFWPAAVTLSSAGAVAFARCRREQARNR